MALFVLFSTKASRCLRFTVGQFSSSSNRLPRVKKSPDWFKEMEKRFAVDLFPKMSLLRSSGRD